jgi:NAD(P)-dependent dehydrogenase (short-subunit alcohol dehydrogenase family)
MSFEGKVVAITGASAGIGRATVREFAARGADVGLIARGEERLQAAAREVEQAGRRACVAPADVADADAVEAAAARIEAELGPIDVWVNVAMTAVLAELWDCTPEELLRTTQVTYLGSMHGIQAALRRFRPRDAGVIVQVGSALSRRGIPLQSSYCASKHAVKGALDSLRAELLHEGSKVKVSLVQLPGVNTPQFDWVRTRLHRHPQPVPPIYQPEVAARAVAYAAEHPRRELWVGCRPSTRSSARSSSPASWTATSGARTRRPSRRASRSTPPRASTTSSHLPPGTPAPTACSTARRTRAARSFGWTRTAGWWPAPRSGWRRRARRRCGRRGGRRRRGGYVRLSGALGGSTPKAVSQVPSSGSRRLAKHAPESNRGRHSEVTAPSRGDPPDAE